MPAATSCRQQEIALHEPARRWAARGRADRRHPRVVRFVRRPQEPADRSGAQRSGLRLGGLAWEPVGQRLVVEQVYDHQGNIGNGTVPLLVLDMWEHAYYLQYQHAKGDWVTAFWKVVNWEDAAQRFQNVRTLDLAL
jgi:hypothetical protein